MISTTVIKIEVLSIIFCLYTSDAQSLLEGSPCQTRDKRDGACSTLPNCPSIDTGVQRNTISYNSLVICGYTGDKGEQAIVCCPDRTANVTTPRPNISKENASFVILFPEAVSNKVQTRGGPRTADKACNRYSSENITIATLTSHIISGVPVQPGEFPHMVALGYESTEQNVSVNWNCGGTLISDRYVLTAAHCVFDPSRRPYLVRLGKITLNSQEDRLRGIDAGIEHFHVFTSYTSSLQYNDIALIRLNFTVEFRDVIKPACLNTDPTILSANTSLTVTGWGDINNAHEKSDILLKANLSYIPLDSCNASYANLGLDNLRRLPNGLQAEHMCAFNSSADACDGDSGGPIQLLNWRGRTSLVVGVTSFGLDCVSKIPGVYVNVYNYLDWIEGIVWPSGVI